MPLLGPQSPLRASASRRRGDVSRAAGNGRGSGIALRLVLAEQEATWCWQVRLENRSSQERTVDLLYGQDLALASHGAVRLNEHYVSHYVDFSPLEHARCGWVVAARQNLDAGRAASLGGGGVAAAGHAPLPPTPCSSSDSLSGWAASPPAYETGCPSRRLQHEHAMAAVQDEAVTLAPGAAWAGGFFVALEADHPPEPPPRTTSQPSTRRCRGPVPCRCLRAAWPRPARVAGPTPRSSTSAPVLGVPGPGRGRAAAALSASMATRGARRRPAAVLLLRRGRSRGAAREGGADAATARPHPADGPGPGAGGSRRWRRRRGCPASSTRWSRRGTSASIGSCPPRTAGWGCSVLTGCGCSCGWTAAGSSWGCPPRSRCGRAPAAGSTGTPRERSSSRAPRVRARTP